MIIPEQEFVANVLLEVVRSGGVFGRVQVSWQTTGEHTQNEVTPTSGEVHTYIVIIAQASLPSMRLVGRPALSSQDFKSHYACGSLMVSSNHFNSVSSQCAGCLC